MKGTIIIVQLSALVLLGIVTTATAEEKPPSYGEQLDRDMQMAAIIAVSDSGDIDLFGGSVIVPSTRPSVETCGIHMSKSAEGRAAELRERRRAADDEAIKRRFSPRERHAYTIKATAALKSCERKFETRCKEIREGMALEIRKAAVDQARKSIDRLAKGPQEKETVRGYLKHVLAACPLEQ